MPCAILRSRGLTTGFIIRWMDGCQGVISEDDLLESSEEEILEGLFGQGVVAVRRIFICRDGQERPSKHLVLTFASTVLSENIKAGYLHCKREEEAMEVSVDPTEPPPPAKGGTYSDAVHRGPAPRTESRATQFSFEDLAGPSQAPKQPAGKQGALGNAGSTQPPQSIQARPPADRQPRASSSFQDGERGRRSNSLEAARLVTEQQSPPAAPSTSKDGSTNVGGSRPSTSKPSSAGSGRGRKLVAQASDQVGTGKPASKVQDAVGAVDIADSSGPSSDQEDMEWQTAKSKQKGKKPVVPP
ncbi:hypothetical protein ISCGN_031694 [Ixodes scapularis]